jgi:hypothetical protein
MNYNSLTPQMIDLDDLGLFPERTPRFVWIKMWRDVFLTLFPNYSVDVSLGFIDNQNYLVKKSLLEDYPKSFDKMGFANATLYGGITAKGDLFFLPVYHPRSKNQQQYRFYMNRVKMAQSNWINIKEDDEGSHVTIKTFENILQPEPEMTLAQMINEAFPGEYYIQNSQHPLLRKKQLQVYDYEDIEDIELSER